MLRTTRRVSRSPCSRPSRGAGRDCGSATAAYVQQRVWGEQGSAEGQFQSPQGVATATGKVFVADAYNSRIQAFDPLGDFLITWGWGVKDGLVDAGDLHHLLPGGDRAGRATARSAPRPGSPPSTRYVYVADFQNSRIQRFRSDGKGAVPTWGSYGVGNTQFKNPAAVAADFSGHVYVADTGNNRIKKFSSTGGYLAKWGNAGSGDAQFQYPWGIAADPQGNVYVADTYNNRVQKFSANGKFLAKWGRRGSGKGQFYLPFGIATDSAGQRLRRRHLQRPDREVLPQGQLPGPVGEARLGQGAVPRRPRTSPWIGQGTRLRRRQRTTTGSSGTRAPRPRPTRPAASSRSRGRGAT